nr:hypothetical protein [Methanospirillum lacunae]
MTYQEIGIFHITEEVRQNFGEIFTFIDRHFSSDPMNLRGFFRDNEPVRLNHPAIFENYFSFCSCKQPGNLNYPVFVYIGTGCFSIKKIKCVLVSCILLIHTQPH